MESGSRIIPLPSFAILLRLTYCTFVDIIKVERAKYGLPEIAFPLSLPQLTKIVPIVTLH